MARELKLSHRTVGPRRSGERLDRALGGCKGRAALRRALLRHLPADGGRLPADEGPLPRHHRRMPSSRRWLRGRGEAEAAGVMLLPGVGFDVVPSDCLAAHLKRRLPRRDAWRSASAPGGVSRGTATTMVENLDRGGSCAGRCAHARAGGVADADDRLRAGPRTAMTIPWGDVSTAYHSTGIPDIEVYMAAPWRPARRPGPCTLVGWLLRPGPALVEEAHPVRTAGAQRRGAGPRPVPVVGRGVATAGRTAVSRLEGPEGYTLTVMAALAVVQSEVLAGTAPPGFQTPSRAYGADFVLTLEGVARHDEG